ncbi:HAD family hydrolase [Actinokineospora diospyrosa]|uniref:Phosphoglycolate phosphatase n=1 Tax=Actinokineospora diospyrosa TaxID=103728 RepID=A0ABT1IHU1_9PSEU|nr:HAD hydrolase-like protein [Actinokineospora diospyrosa]MCP2271831.1 phosphoglycolate phosphatase [Actinokineospora diospyrosa]
MPLAVGFDLDMTLIDPRPGMVAAMAALAAETGLPLDGEYFAANLGPPLDMIFRGFEAPEERIPWLVDRFRALYPEIVIPATVALPGATEALAAVHEAGGRTLVVTGKYGPNAAKHLAQFGWTVDVLVGERWSTAKGETLLEHGATIYIGDHEGDMAGALAAGALAIGVPTGPHSAADLRAAGADVVLTNLTEFPAWLKSHLAAH